MRRRLMLPLLLASHPASAQSRRRREAGPRLAQATPEIDPAPRPGLAPMPDRRFPDAPTTPGATVTEPRLVPGVPTAPAPTRGASFADRDANPERTGGESVRPEPGVSLTVPLGPGR